MTALADLSQNVEIPAEGLADKAVTTRKQMLDVQWMEGNNNAYAAITANGFLKRNTTEYMQLFYTPPFDAWWEIAFLVGILQKTETGDGYSYVAPALGLAAAFGPAQYYASATQKSDNQQFGTRSGKVLFPLTAGLAYSCALSFSIGGVGTGWQYHQAAQYLFMHGKAWARDGYA